MALAQSGDTTITYDLSSLPPYLSALFAPTGFNNPVKISLLQLPQIRQLSSRSQQYAYLLLLQHSLTDALREGGLQPVILLQRAFIHEALGYWELAVGDAYSVVTVAEYEEEGGGDLVGIWGVEGREEEQLQTELLVRHTKRKGVRLLKRCLEALGCGEVARGRWEEDGEDDEIYERPGRNEQEGVDEGRGWCILQPGEIESWDEIYHFGLSRREIYPWNSFEGDRMSDHTLKEINVKLSAASEGQLEVRKTVLPDVTSSKATTLHQRAASRLDSNESGSRSSGNPVAKENAQLGLFATRNLAPDKVILTERSALTAIRPHGEALCDACAGDLSEIAASERQVCPGCGIPFCSTECLEVATKTYHAPNTSDEETEEGYPPAATPFCPGSVAETDISNLGRAESSDTPEWDLYFLLVTRALQMAETLDCHPLELWECKHLWGSFEPALSQAALESRDGRGIKLKRTLPFSLRHHIELPLQWFELLLLSRDLSGPYTKRWVERYDWWVIQTLFAKFRGVADAKMSSWTGEPETAGVFPLWCLANHSCDPGVTWEGGGVRRLRVRKDGEVLEENEPSEEWTGLKEGEEIWNHYSDVREKDYKVRRDRLREVLGGDCRCRRCVREEQAQNAA